MRLDSLLGVVRVILIRYIRLETLAQATEAGQLESQVDLALEKCGSVEGVGDGSVGADYR